MKTRIVLFVLATLLCSCSVKMPLSRIPASTAVSSDKSLGIFTLEIRNDFKNYAPRPLRLEVRNSNPQASPSRSALSFGRPDRELGEKGFEVIASVDLPPGQYYITKLIGRASSFPIVGNFDFNPDKHFTLRPNDVAYLGHVVARLVEKTSDSEERAGPIIPLIDQAVTGFSNGTFKVEVQDKYDEDCKTLKDRFPALTGTNIRKEILR